MKEESRQAIEPQFLLQAQSSGTALRISQMNKTEHEGTIRDIGRYEVTIDEKGQAVTILKQEIAYFSAPHPLLVFSSPFSAAADADEHPENPGQTKPNIQQEFLDKAIKENQLLTLFLINGQRLKASIEAYDNFTLLVKDGGKQHLYYKHAITTINR